jgi:type III secretion protein L
MSEQVFEPMPTEPRLRPIGPIVRREDAQTWMDAAEVLAGCRAYAERRRAEADAAYAEQYRRGLAEGRKQADTELAARAEQTRAEAQAYFARLDGELPSLVLGIVEDIIGSFDEQDILLRAIRHALHRAQMGADAKLMVSNDACDEVRSALAADPHTADILVEPDPALSRSEAVIRTGFGSIEVGAASQLRALHAGLAADLQATGEVPA